MAVRYRGAQGRSLIWPLFCREARVSRADAVIFFSLKLWLIIISCRYNGVNCPEKSSVPKQHVLNSPWNHSKLVHFHRYFDRNSDVFMHVIILNGESYETKVLISSVCIMYFFVILVSIFLMFILFRRNIYCLKLAYHGYRGFVLFSRPKKIPSRKI